MTTAATYPPMRIGTLARKAGVSVQTVRYYERRGLLDDPRDRDSVFREYTMETLQRLQFIRRAQELGFTLSQIAELLTMRLDPGTRASDVKARADAKMLEIDARIEDLRRIRSALEQLAGRCRGGRGPTGDCPLLEALGPIHPAGLGADGA